MQRSQTSTDALAGDLMRFLSHVMKGEQGELFELVAELDLTMAQMRGMFVLNAADHELALTELAPRMGLSVAAAGRSVDGLVHRELVARSEDPADRRIKRLSVTDAGHAALRRIAEARFIGLLRFVETLGEVERAALAGALTKVLEQWDSERER